MFSGTHSLNSDWGTSYFHDFLTWHVLTHGPIFRAPFSYTTCQYGCVHRYIQLWKKNKRPLSQMFLKSASLHLWQPVHSSVCSIPTQASSFYLYWSGDHLNQILFYEDYKKITKNTAVIKDWDYPTNNDF